MPVVSCKIVAMQNSSGWPCSMCPIPQFRVAGVRTSHIFFWYFLDTLSSGPRYKSLFGSPFGCTLLQCGLFLLCVTQLESHTIGSDLVLSHGSSDGKQSEQICVVLPLCSAFISWFQWQLCLVFLFNFSFPLKLLPPCPYSWCLFLLFWMYFSPNVLSLGHF